LQEWVWKGLDATHGGRTVEIEAGPEFDKIMMNLLKSATYHPCGCNARDGDSTWLGKMKKVKVWRWEIPWLWREYRTCAEALRDRNRRLGPRVRDPPVGKYHTEFCRPPPGEQGITEVMLFHGTMKDVKDKIRNHGFNQGFSKGGRYGEGLYFAPEACKAGQYARPCAAGRFSGGFKHYLIYARVVLGNPYYVGETESDIGMTTWNWPHHDYRYGKEPKPGRFPDGTIQFAYTERDAPPYRDPATGDPLPGNHYDSVIANHGCITRRSFPKEGQYHQEFVVYDKNQAYPEYLIEITV
jgi:hypothetical protein